MLQNGGIEPKTVCELAMTVGGANHLQATSFAPAWATLNSKPKTKALGTNTAY